MGNKPVKIKRKEANLCIYCGGAKEQSELQHCNECSIKVNAFKKAWVTKCRKEYKCPNCGQQLDRQGLSCGSCVGKARIKSLERNKIRRELKLCVQCGDKVTETVYCRKCLDYRMDRYRRVKYGES